MLMTSQAFAGLTVKLYDQDDGQPKGYRDPNACGGEFTAVLSGNSALNTCILDNYSQDAKTSINGVEGIETFCVETAITFLPGAAYDASIGSQIKPNVAPGSTSIAVGAAWLYQQFVTGDLSASSEGGYEYTTLTASGREKSGDELQDAIWYLEGEITSTGRVVSGDDVKSVNNSTYNFIASTDPFLLAAEEYLDPTGKTQAAQLAYVSQAATAGEYGVYALVLSTTSDGCANYAQDQLVYCPVPEPATFTAGALLMLPLGLSAFRVLRRNQSLPLDPSSKEGTL